MVLPVDADGEVTTRLINPLRATFRHDFANAEFVGYIVEKYLETGRPTACVSIIVTRASDPYGATGDMTNCRGQKLLVVHRLLSEHWKILELVSAAIPGGCRRTPLLREFQWHVVIAIGRRG